ncbi:solute carrier family 35 member SLC35F1/F2/F6 [Zychaea mexicana]|uniref:solute carrier family 35 member SLC35F1/F2/F6 n=1 Tax=Zychaea mexicana TaxID=64656 RepID=UPI0022FE3ACD|nr:solute carrier family 35 member SLC35F1/F2/F6 [Zychaea mexicana]KAI9489838.1 solute carrier family 35 member SLC35F1/F2/F6 [Zychaea mexicana]
MSLLRDRGQWLLPLCLGQILSLCITGTSVASSALWTRYSISIPYTQNFCTYLVLFVVHTLRFHRKNKKRSSHGNDLDDQEHEQQSRNNPWYFFGFSFADVQANILAVLAFKSTSVLSALIVSSWTLPCIMLLSTLCLGYRYQIGHFGGVVLCLLGLFMLIWADTMSDEASTNNHSWIGDLICLISATLYAISNVTEEYLVNRCSTEEFLSRAGFWGSILSGIQALTFEHAEWLSIDWQWNAVGLILVYIVCLSSMYSLGPTLYRISNATFISMSLITANFYSLLAGLLFLDAKMPPFYPLAYILVICGVTLYNLTTPPRTNHNEYQCIKNDSES